MVNYLKLQSLAQCKAETVMISPRYAGNALFAKMGPATHMEVQDGY